MQKVLKIASSYVGKTSPDPAVAALIVKNGKIISIGYHNKFKSPHAETYAINKAKGKTKGATLYVNLEPCCHWGNTPPCTDNIIKSGIKRVVAAMQDPNPLVNGKGFKQLKDAGIEVVSGVLEKEAKKLNEAFIKFITTKMPFVTLKMAMSLDGKIATYTGQSKWISCKESRKYTHKIRSIVDAVIIGKNTAIKDNPLLTVREIPAKKQPIRIIVDSKASIPLSNNLVKDKTTKTIIATTKYAPKKNLKQLEKMHCEILVLPSKNKQVDLKQLLLKLGQMNITNILVEGGSQIATSFIENDLVDKIIFIFSPIIIGGDKSCIVGKGVKKLQKAIKINDICLKKIGCDIVLEGYIEKKGDKI